MNGSSIFLSPVIATFLIGTLQISHPANYPPLESQEKKAFPPAWLVLLPFQNAPGPRSSDADTHNLNPYGKPDSSQPPEAHQSGIRFDRCIDTDMCLFIITEKNNQRERQVMVELFGTDVPHLRESCEQERVLATDAMEFLQQILSDASQIEVYDHYKVGRKHMARVVVDGQDLSELLISQGLAAPKGHGSKNWCTD
jgi:endonuclease YncB( thermonuclease family)